MTAAWPKKKNRTSMRPHTLQMCISHKSAGMRPGPWEPSGPLCLHGTAASRASSPLTRVLSDPLLLFCRLRDESGREAGSSRSCCMLSCLCQGQLADVTAAPSLGDPLPPPRWVCSPRGGGLTPSCFLGRGGLHCHSTSPLNTVAHMALGFTREPPLALVLHFEKRLVIALG